MILSHTFMPIRYVEESIHSVYSAEERAYQTNI